MSCKHKLFATLNQICISYRDSAQQIKQKKYGPELREFLLFGVHVSWKDFNIQKQKSTIFNQLIVLPLLYH